MQEYLTLVVEATNKSPIVSMRRFIVSISIFLEIQAQQLVKPDLNVIIHFYKGKAKQKEDTTGRIFKESDAQVIGW